jgi:peroxiredoxin
MGWSVRPLTFLLLLGLSLLFAACNSGGPNIHLDSGTMAPDFSLPDLSGKTINFKKDMGRGKTYLLFWSSSCVSCKEGMTMLEEVYKKSKDGGFSVLAINVYQDKDTVSAFTKELGITYPVLLDTTGDVATAYEVFAIPVAYVIDSTGTVLDKFMGEMTEENVEAIIKKYW